MKRNSLAPLEDVSPEGDRARSYGRAGLSGASARSAHRIGMSASSLKLGVITVLLVVMVGGLPAQASDASVETAGTRPFGRTHGAGSNKPAYNDGQVKWRYMCIPGTTRFKVTRASIVMWSRGDRIKGFEFKYRVIPVAPGLNIGQDWSGTVKTSFPQGSNQTRRMTAGALGQSRGSELDWGIEVRLKYPRSLRLAKRYKWQIDIVEPPCGGVTGGS